ncbi:uncharacterized protein LOC114266943 [Camellia sinensis]|uniref:uncharacterized protein LOC114266943 n=1 Tax=Camellia sinensis TaxID=4442 RepID=UPI001035D16E|nr:uncharacterized protein LOC114266943 [Camellia sinensis]
MKSPQFHGGLDPLKDETWVLGIVKLFEVFRCLETQKKVSEFMELKQNSMTVVEHEAKFTELARFAPHVVDTDYKKARHFEGGLRDDILEKLNVLKLETYIEIQYHLGKANTVADALSRKLIGNSACLLIEHKEILLDFEKTEIEVVLHEQTGLIAAISAEPTIITEIKQRQKEDKFLKKVINEVEVRWFEAVGNPLVIGRVWVMTDVVVKSNSYEEHLEDLKKSFKKMKEFNLKMYHLKCAFVITAGNFLRFLVHQRGIDIDKNKTRAIQKAKPPNCKNKLFSQGCLPCQVYGPIQHAPTTSMNSIAKPWPFRDRSFDMIGKIFPPSSKDHSFIVVAMNYFTKWTEAIPMKSVNQSDIIKMIKESIIHRFILPQHIVANRGTIFFVKEV